MPPVLLALLVGGGGLGLLALRKKGPKRQPPHGGGAGKSIASVGGGTVAALAKGIDLISKADVAVVKAVGGNQAQQDTARVAGLTDVTGFGLPVTAGLVIRDLVSGPVSKALGITDPKAANIAGQTAGVVAGATMVAGPIGTVGALAIEGVAQGANALLGAIDKGAQKSVDDFLHNLDPTATGTAGAQVVGAITGFVNGIFGGGTPKPTAAQTAAATAAGKVVQATNLAVATAQAKQTFPNATPAQQKVLSQGLANLFGLPGFGNFH